MRLPEPVLAAAASLAKVIDPHNVDDWVSRGGPWMIFALLFACGLGLPLPEDIPLLAGGYFVATGNMNLALLAVLAWLGIIGGDCLLYRFGYKYGLNVTKVPLIGRHFTQERILRAERLFDRWGIWVVAIGRLITGVRGAMVVAAGAIRFNFLKFLLADGLAVVVSGGVFVGLGYWLGKKLGNFDQAVDVVKPYVEWFIGLSILAVVVLIAYQWWKHRNRPAVTDVALATAVAVTDKLAPPPAPAQPALPPAVQAAAARTVPE